MAMDNMNKSKETTHTTTIALKVNSTLEDHYPQKLKSPLLDQNLLSKSTFEYEDCAAKFTSYETVFENFMNWGPKGGILILVENGPLGYFL